MKIKYNRAPHSGRVYITNLFSDRMRQGFHPIEWDEYQKRMKESFPDGEFEEVPLEEKHE